MHEKLIAAYDFGTSGCKVALIDLRGTVRCSASVSYGYETNAQGWAEQDPRAYWDALCRVTPAALAKGGYTKDSVCAVAMATIWKGIIPLDREGRVLYPNILWLDGRAAAEAEVLRRSLDTPYLSHKDYWPKLLWYRTQRPELYEKTDKILEVNSYLRFLLTGALAVDRSNHFTRSADARSQASYDRFLEAADIRPDLFPPLVSSSDQVGKVTERAAEQSGLPAGIPVFAGCTDVMAIPVGVGATRQGDSHAYLGTSGWFGQITPLEKRKSCFLAAPYTRDADVSFYGLNMACPAVDWAISRFYPEETRQLGGGIYAFLEQDLADVPAGSMGLLATTWLHGERPPVHETARGLYLNICSQHDRRHFVTAMREAAAYMFRWKRELTEQVSGVHSPVVRAVGGGALSGHWMQILANVLRTPVELTASPQFAGALGASACALVGMGELSGFDEVRSLVGTAQCFEPQDCGTVYEELYQAYRELSALNGIFDRLNKGHG